MFRLIYMRLVMIKSNYFFLLGTSVSLIIMILMIFFFRVPKGGTLL